jgi:hypothetical protein
MRTSWSRGHATHNQDWYLIPYWNAFLNFERPESLTYCRKTCQETLHKSSTKSNSRIENYDYYRKIRQLRILRQNPNLIVFSLPVSYQIHFDLWTSYLAMILFLKGCGSLFWESPNSAKIFNGLQHSFWVWQWFINVSKSFSYKVSLFILAITGKKDFTINSTFRSNFVVYFGTS